MSKKPAPTRINEDATPALRWLMIIFAVLFCVLGLVVILTEGHEEGATTSGIMFLVFALFFAGVAFWSSRTSLVIDENGVYYRLSEKRQGALRWEEIKTVAVVRYLAVNGRMQVTLVVSTLPEAEALTRDAVARAKLPADVHLNIPMTKKRIQCIQRYIKRDVPIVKI